MRAFLALPLPPEVTAPLIDLQATLPTGRPVPEDNLHLTLAFLGDVDAPVLASLDDLLSASRLPPAEIIITGLGTFSEMERGLVFADLTATDSLKALHAKTAHLCRSAGADLPRRRFRPHVTLMRSNRQPAGPARDRLAAALGPIRTVPACTARTLCLYHSDLTPNGARHEVLATYPLG